MELTKVLKPMACPSCAVDYAIPKAMHDRKLSEGGSWYCPNGHSIHFTTPEVDKLRRERDRLVQDQARLEEDRKLAWNTANRQADLRKIAERQVTAYKGVITKTKRRVANGVCPCCNRTLVDLKRHMATKHPEYEGSPT